MVTKQFGIKSLLVATLLIACAIVGFLKWQHYQKWNPVRKKLSGWAASLERNPGKVESYSFDYPHQDSMEFPGFSIHTGEPLRAIGSNGEIIWAFNSDAKVDPERFFVIPSWKWVNDIDAAIDVWSKLPDDDG